MHEMQTTAIDDPGRLSCGFTRLRCANTAERIEVLLGVDTLGNLRNTVLQGVPISLTDSMRHSPNYFVHLNLPDTIINSPSLTTFKTRLKSHLFNLINKYWTRLSSLHLVTARTSNSIF